MNSDSISTVVRDYQREVKNRLSSSVMAKLDIDNMDDILWEVEDGVRGFGDYVWEAIVSEIYLFNER